MKTERTNMYQPIDIVRLYKKIPKIYRIVFFLTFTMGVLAHLFILTNKIITFDDLMCMNSFGGSFGSGRWFLGILGLVKYKILGNYSMPALNGIVTMLLLALFACLVNAVLENKNVLVAMLVGLSLVVFPTIAGNLSFMFTSYYYCFGLVLLGIGVLLIVRAKRFYGVITGAFCLTLSIAIYQAYFPFAIALLICKLLLDTMYSQTNWIALLKKSFLYLFGLVLSLVIYFGINKFWLWYWKIEMVSHKGMNQMGEMDIWEIPQHIKKMYKAFELIITQNYYGITGNIWVRSALCILFLISSVILIKTGLRLFKEKKWLQAVELIVFSLLLPIGIHSIYFMVAEEYIYTLMVYADVLLIVFPIVLCEFEITYLIEAGEVKIRHTIMNWLVNVVVIFICVFYICQNNAAYLEMELSLSAAKSYYTTMITQIKSIDGYSPEKDVIIVGENEDESIYEIKKDFFQDVEIGGAYETDRFIRDVLVDRFMKYYCGFDQVVEQGTVKIEKAILDTMEEYPKQGSIKLVDDKIIVKLSNDN